jgi:hypothetical protein
MRTFLIAIVVLGCATGAEDDGSIPTVGTSLDSGAAAEAAVSIDSASGDDSTVLTASEICGNGIDDDDDGLIDEGCPCATGETQACTPKGMCKPGKQTCEGSGEFARFGECVGASACTDASVPDTAKPDTGGCAPVAVALEVPTDCSTVKCPASHPYLVGCLLKFDGDDCEGCVAHKAGTPSIYVQEGYRCGSSARVSGSYLKCSSCGPSVGALNATNCPMFGKDKKFYAADPTGCPTTNTCP